MLNHKNYIIYLVFLLFSNTALAYKGGIIGFSNNPNCNNCHNTGIVPSVSFTGITTVVPGETTAYSFTITGGQQQIGGLNISATGGTLLVQASDTSIRKSGAELTHTQPATINAGNISWSFNWQAPTTAGTYTLYGAGVSANNDNTMAGDNTAQTSLTITVGTSGPVPTAIIVSPQTALLDASVLFDGASSTAPSGATITQYEWSLNGVDFVIGANGYQTSFNTAGRHTVTLRITDSNNDIALIFADIIIGDKVIPVVNHNGPYSAETGVNINFDASNSVSDSSTSITKYIWDFGDGSNIEQGSSATISHVYTKVGSYTVTIAAQDGLIITGVDKTTVTITAPVQPETGKEIYDTRCLSCHGSNGTGGTAKNIQGAKQALILNAISTVPTMSGIPITNDEALLLEEFLTVVGSSDEILYINNCQVCHGVSGVGIVNTAPPVIGGTRVMIEQKIVTVPSMSGIVLTSAESQLIANFLGNTSAITGSDYYLNKCAICHGATGAGIIGVGPLVKGAPQFMITDAINNVNMMNGIILSTTNAQLISDYLGTGGVTGQEAYFNKCTLCHGDAGIGRIGYGPTIKGASDYMIRGEVINVVEMQGINLEAKSQLIADYLGLGGTTGQDYYNNKCFICHGDKGIGSSSSYNGGNIQGVSWQKIQSAITKKKEMLNIILTDTDAQAIEVYLK